MAAGVAPYVAIVYTGGRMGRNRLAVVLVAVAATFAACRYSPTHVPLRGSTTDIAALAGTWDGEYSSAASGRSGVIIFEFTAGVDTAHGDVLMTPQRGQSVRATDAGTTMHAEHVRSVEWLTVRFVRVEDGMVRGVLESYIAPDCQCPVNTVFRGAVRGGRMEGTYTTRGAGGLAQEGRWTAKRSKD
jgi:hypothetical protein